MSKNHETIRSGPEPSVGVSGSHFCSPQVTEIAVWQRDRLAFLLDMEHAPNDLEQITEPTWRPPGSANPRCADDSLRMRLDQTINKRLLIAACAI